MLWLVDSSIGEEGAVALTKVLHELKHLTKVGIVSCALGDRGTAAVAAALKQMHRLFHVSFRRNGIGDAGVDPCFATASFGLLALSWHCAKV